MSRLPQIIFAAAAFAVGLPALGQNCWELEQYQTVMPPGPLASGDGYGTGMFNLEAGSPLASSDEWLFVGAPGDDQIGADAGAVYVYRLDQAAWVYHEKLVPSGGQGMFGFSVATDGQRLIVGARKDANTGNPNALGVAYTFVFNGTNWVQEHRLLPFGSGDAKENGWAVAIAGNLAVVGAWSHNGAPVNGKGVAFIYQFDGTQWVPQQMLMSDTPAVLDRFGTALAISQGMILAGCPRNHAIATNAGAMFAFEHDGAQWVQHSRWHAFDGASGDQFGGKIAADGTALVVGAMFDDHAGGTDAGSAYLFNWDGTTWAAGPKLMGSNAATSDQFGSALHLQGNQIIVGAPMRNVQRGQQSYPGGGAFYIFEMSNGGFVEVHYRELFQPASGFYGYAPIECWANGVQPENWPQSLTSAQLGKAAHLSVLGPLASSAKIRARCGDQPGHEDSGALYLFETIPIFDDCNSNGVPDGCDSTPDCNNNYVPDSCELASQSSGDCNKNGIPDECDSGPTYQLENGTALLAWGPNPAGPNVDFIWMNQFRVKPGGQIVAYVEMSSTPFMPLGAPITLLLYSDPTDDGDPTDAILLATAQTDALSNEAFPVPLLKVAIAPTYVGEVGKIFFVGALVHAPVTSHHGWFPAVTVNGANSTYTRSWQAQSTAGQADINNLSNNTIPPTLWLQPSFMIRAVAADCNANGTWDACDIANGSLPDKNNNGIPDGCEVNPCFYADVYPTGVQGDGVVNVSDLLHVVNNWGGCSPCYTFCPGDTNDDCLVNVSDLLAVINGWGPCP